MTNYVYTLSDDQSEPEPDNKRFEAWQFLRGLPKPTTERGDHAGRQDDPAFKWVDIPNVFAYYNSLASLRLRYPAFQFDKADSRGARVTYGKQAGKLGFRVRVRYNPHV